MIEFIHQRLLQWADWSANGHRAKGLGYSPCTLRKWSAKSTFCEVADPRLDEESIATDAAVTALPEELRQCVMIYYLKSGTVRQKARDLGMSHETMYQRLHHAQQRVSQLLEEGKKPRHWPKRNIF